MEITYIKITINFVTIAVTRSASLATSRITSFDTLFQIHIRLGDIVIHRWRLVKTAAFDLTVVSPMYMSNIRHALTKEASVVTNLSIFL